MNEGIPKLKVVGLVKDRAGAEFRIHFFGDVAAKVVLMEAKDRLLCRRAGWVDGWARTVASGGPKLAGVAGQVWWDVYM